jgi:hypothetical protein
MTFEVGDRGNLSDKMAWIAAKNWRKAVRRAPRL